MPLTDTHIRSLKPEAKPRKYFDGGGLFLFVPPTGSKLWRMSYRFEGKSKLLSFGGYPAVSLKDARARREEAKVLLDEVSTCQCSDLSVVPTPEQAHGKSFDRRFLIGKAEL